MVALGTCGILKATGRGETPIRIPEGTRVVDAPRHGERAFIPPAGLDRFVTCGDHHDNLNSQSYERNETLDGQQIEIICGSKDLPVPADFPVEPIR